MAAKDYEEFTMDNLESIEQAANSLSSKGMTDDTPSGSTPRKRKWQYADEWSLTQNREDLLSNWRRQKSGQDDVDMDAEPRKERRHQASNSIGSENEAPIEEALPPTKAEVLRAEVPVVEPLVESRRRNASTIPSRASSRRAR